MKKPFIYGFLFGTVGMYILAMLSLVSQTVERFTGFLFVPGRYAASLLAGSEGSDLEVIMLLLLNGVFYALVFWFIRFLYSKIKGR